MDLKNAVSITSRLLVGRWSINESILEYFVIIGFWLKSDCRSDCTNKVRVRIQGRATTRGGGKDRQSAKGKTTQDRK